jgi:hypothetical protein
VLTVERCKHMQVMHMIIVISKDRKNVLEDSGTVRYMSMYLSCENDERA